MNVGEMNMLVVQLPRGRTAVVRCESVTGLITTNYCGLLTTLFQEGVTDFGGGRRFPTDGLAFLSAVFDHLFLHGYSVRWMNSAKQSYRLNKWIK